MYTIKELINLKANVCNTNRGQTYKSETCTLYIAYFPQGYGTEPGADVCYIAQLSVSVVTHVQ